ncbi:MAG: monofunctional biosynthetic peptidoglycan transglycosylase [Halofilum sp. (in: g-proteobacteria)]|nr:monofunctional biosynthetic peptidoglycan transglycosylase [Halofilum sp. (in: g-proteobacteria)]
MLRPLLRGLGLLLLVAVIALFLLQASYYVRVRQYATENPSTTAFMELRLEELREKNADAELRHRWVAWDRISPWLKRAVIAAEDARFVEHHGIDWEALRKAFDENVEAGRVVRGGSTISQQLAKNLFLSPERSYLRKVQEALIAVMIEQALGKQRILELYLNVIEWGEGVFGAEAAAYHYHGVSAGELNRWQASLLAARIPNPRYYSRRGVTDYLYRRGFDIYGWADKVRVPGRN